MICLRELVIICCNVLYAWYWAICRYMNLIFEWSEPDDHCHSWWHIGCHWHPKREASEGWWAVRTIMCFLQMQERNHRSATVGTMQIKFAKSWNRENGIRISFICCVKYEWHSQISSHSVAIPNVKRIVDGSPDTTPPFWVAVYGA